MNQRDFNRQMGAYLTSRRDHEDGRSFIDKIKESFPKVELANDEPEVIPSEDVSKEAVQAVLRGEQLAPKAEESVEKFEEEPDRRIVKPWWQKMIDKLTIPYDKDELLDANEDMIEEEVAKLASTTPKHQQIGTDVKEMLRICVHWVNQLPPEQIQEIKRSDDFVKFKKLLEKYDLLKK